MSIVKFPINLNQSVKASFQLIKASIPNHLVRVCSGLGKRD